MQSIAMYLYGSGPQMSCKPKKTEGLKRCATNHANKKTVLIYGYFDVPHASLKREVDLGSIAATIWSGCSGMEENGSEGLDELIEQEAKEWFKGVDCYGNYWLNSARPGSCTVFEASCTSSSPSPAPAATLHSGIFGPTVHEPIDMGSVTDAEER
ncbi:hypothetical protein K438DRAFT_2031975 [Mycena galopus ATCC 62051]|nr:hypothetical protein K438DRAFT_2031975 [Mycena galopus ATCC 62051]